MRRRLTDVEALLWGLEQHPMLASTMGSIVMLDSSPDPSRVRAAIASAVTTLEPLRLRVAAPPLPLADLTWEPDPDFDLDHHVRVLRVPARSSFDDVIDLATQIINDPFDRSRPPWAMTLLTGLPNKKSALVIKAHHSIADGQGMLRLGLALFDLDPSSAPTSGADVSSFSDHHDDATTIEGVNAAIRGRVERILGLAVDALATLGSPARVSSLTSDIAAITQILGGGVVERPSVSTLWSRRTRNRRSFHLGASLSDMRAEAATRECSINDLFVTAVAEATIDYHRTHEVELDHVALSVAVSTRTDDHPDAHNAVVPCGIVVPGSGFSTAERLHAIAVQVADRRASLPRHERRLDKAGQLAGLVPPAIAAAAAVEQSRKLDIATSNLPGPPIALWLAGSGVEWISPLGPVGGTACNITMLTFVDEASFGVHYDPAAVADAGLLASGLRSSLARLNIDCRRRSPRTR